MDRIIRDLLSYSKLTNDEITFNRVSLTEVINAVIETMSVTITEKNARVIVPNDLPSIAGEKTLCAQLFKNLIENGLTYCSPDKDPHVEISWKRNEQDVVVCVHDNGIGIAPEYFEKIFQIFQRLHTNEEYPGTGIGLALVSKAAKILKGQVWVESDPNQGSKFFVKLQGRLRDGEM